MKASVGSFLLPIQVVCAQINMMCLCIRQFQATSGNAHKLQVEDECSRIHWRGFKIQVIEFTGLIQDRSACFIDAALVQCKELWASWHQLGTLKPEAS